MVQYKNTIIKKNIALVVALVTVYFSVGAFASKTNAEKAFSPNDIIYEVYDAQTGKHMTEKDYVIDSDAFIPESSVGTNSVIGSDTRYQDWEMNGVVKIMNSSSYIGTGFVVGDHTIATAAHCVKGQSISEIKLFDGDGNVKLTVTPYEYHYPSDYTNDFHDYALIKVQDDLSAYRCFSFGVPLDGITSAPYVQEVFVTGFPGDKSNTHTSDKMYTGKGHMININKNQLFYDADTNGGNSGGPVYVKETLGTNVYYTVIGIHTNGVHGTEAGNRGVRINTDIISFYLNSER